MQIIAHDADFNKHKERDSKETAGQMQYATLLRQFENTKTVQNTQQNATLNATQKLVLKTPTEEENRLGYFPTMTKESCRYFSLRVLPLPFPHLFFSFLSRAMLSFRLLPAVFVDQSSR